MELDTGAFVVVSLEREHGPASEIVGILAHFGIPAELMERRATVRQPRTIAMLIPPDRVSEAVLALEIHGFPDVRVYEAKQPLV
jgi:hypothetical protein